MRTVSTDSLVLHAFDYRETSRIVRLATRDVGIVSVIARGARRPKSKFGSAFDLFTSGVAHLSLHPTGDLHTLSGFDVTRSRGQLAGSLARFGAASALAEVCIRFGSEDDSGRVLQSAEEVFDLLGDSAAADVAGAAIGGIWRVVGDLGFAPSLDSCASCHSPLDADAPVTFHHRVGGALCPSCARRTPGGRTLPATARSAIAAWLAGERRAIDDEAGARAHRRLLREFLEEHLGDGRALRAFVAWEALKPAPSGVGAA